MALDGTLLEEPRRTVSITYSYPDAATVGEFTEAEIAAGGQRIQMIITGPYLWESGPAFDNARAAIIAGMTSDQNQAGGWNNTVRDQEVVTAVVRDSETHVTITLSTPAPIPYAITAKEYVVPQVPLAAVASQGQAPNIVEQPITLDVFDVTPSDYWLFTVTQDEPEPTGDPSAGLSYLAEDNRLHYAVDDNRLHFSAHDNRLHFKR